jgi:hypothetical protein
VPDYQGIPFDGGLDSPTGTGAQQIVTTLKAIVDFLVLCNEPGRLKDLSGGTAVDWTTRTLRTAIGGATIQWSAGHLLDPSTTALALDWLARTLQDLSGILSLDWTNRTLFDADGTTPQLIWQNGLFAPALPTSDPMVSGRLWNNLGIVTVSP